MSLLIRDLETVRCTDGRSVRLAVLGPAGLTALFARGWDALGAELDEPGCWFASARCRPAPAGELHVSDTDPFVIDAPGSSDDASPFLLYVHPGVRGFDGHFPHRPILPGVVQVDWAARLAARRGYPGHRFAGLSRLKFNAPVRPGAVLKLLLAPSPGAPSGAAAGTAAAQSLGFRFESQDGIATSGLLHYTHAP